MDIRFQVLGPLRAWCDGREVDLGPVKQRTVLAVLLLGAGRTVTKQEIIDTVWGDDSPPTVENTVQTYVRRLRRSFDPGAGPYDGWLVTTGTGYKVMPDRCGVDLLRFRTLCEQGQELAALALWRGGCVADLGHSFQSGAAVRAVEHERTKAAIAAAQAGRPEEVVEPLRVVAAEDPLNEALHAQLMLVLAAAGRQAEALFWYDDVAGRLADELGVAPSQQLQEARLQVLRQETDAARTPRTAATPGGSWRGRRPATETLVGRDGDVRELTELLHKRRVVTLTGPGGAGKTALALAVAESASDVVVVELGPLPVETEDGDHAGIVAEVVRELLGLETRRGSPVDALVREFNEQTPLLVLDNAEHVIRGTGALVDRLVRDCPGLRFLVTSRQPLGMPAETVWAVGPLAVPPRNAPGDLTEFAAIALFLARVQMYCPSLDLSDELPAVAELCRGLDGLPLALELAAARLRSMPLGTLIERHSLLSAPRRVGLPHQRSLSASVRWSIDLLDPDERMLLQRLTAFVDEFDLEAAEAVAGFAPLDPGRVAELLANLVDRSLVQATRADEFPYRILVPIRETCQSYADADDIAAARDSHLRRLSDLAKVRPERLALAFTDPFAALDWAMRPGSSEKTFAVGVEFLTDAQPLWERHSGARSSLFRWTASALERHEALSPHLRQRLLDWADRLVKGRMPVALPYFIHALENADDSPDGLVRQAAILRGIAGFSHALLETDPLSHVQAAVDTARRSGNSTQAAIACCCGAAAFTLHGQFAEAEALLREALRAAGSDTLMIDVCQAVKASAELRAGRLAEAEVSAQTSLARRAEASQHLVIHSLLTQAWIQMLRDHLEEGLQLIAEASTLCEQTQSQDIMIILREATAYAHWRLGHHTLARRILMERLREALKREHIGVIFRSVQLSAAMAKTASDPMAALLTAAAAHCRNVSGYEPWPLTRDEVAVEDNDLARSPAAELPPGIIDALTVAADHAIEFLSRRPEVTRPRGDGDRSRVPPG